jgi:capsular polysaccharide biosynthesis protein
MENIKNLVEDEVDLLQLWLTLTRYKWLIISLTFIFTIISVFYASKQTSTYTANTTIEIGEFAYENKIAKLDDYRDLKTIISTLLKINVSEINGAPSMLKLSINTNSPEISRKEIQNSIQIIMNRHYEKVKLLDGEFKIRMTQQIGNIEIEKIDPNKNLIIVLGFFGGMLFSIMIVLLLEFVRKIKHK